MIGNIIGDLHVCAVEFGVVIGVGLHMSVADAHRPLVGAAMVKRSSSSL